MTAPFINPPEDSLKTLIDGLEYNGVIPPYWVQKWMTKTPTATDALAAAWPYATDYNTMMQIFIRSQRLDLANTARRAVEAAKANPNPNDPWPRYTYAKAILAVVPIPPPLATVSGGPFGGI